MSARTIVITGASDGIGAAAARSLSAAGDRVVVVGRSPDKTAAVAREIGADAFVADFARLDDVRRLASELLAACPRIDVLANNAGGIMGAREETVDGHEKTFQVNHLGPFLLTTLLMDRLLDGGARVLNTSSAANRAFSRFEIDDLDARKDYSPNRAYGNAKLANILFTTELNRRHGLQGIDTAAFHPGGVATGFATGSTSPMRFVYQTVLRRFLLSAEQGADTLVWLATASPGVDWVPGGYYAKRAIAKVNPQARDADLARELWERSARMVDA